MNFKLLQIPFYIGIVFHLNGCAQIKSCQNSIYIDECGMYNDFIKAPDAVTLKISGDKVAKITLNDCMGNMHLKVYNGKILLIEGGYVNATDTSSIESIGTNVVTGEEKSEIRKVFKPRKDGSWLFYDETGKLLHEDIYKEGILVESKKK
jgi:hypothetical protein